MPKKINVKGPIVSNDVAWFYDWFGWDYACTNKLSQGLEEAAGEDVIIEINSPGGVCVYGYEMYTAIMNYEGKVTVHVISAMSAATLLVCAADEALISDTGIFMIHNAQSSASGDYRDMQMEADALREFNAGIINAYAKKTGKSREEIQALMDKDSYMSPQTAIEHGFIDGYMFGNPDDREDTTENLSTQVVASDIPIITENKVHGLMKMLADKSAKNLDFIKGEEKLEQVAPVQQKEEQKIGAVAGSDKNNEKGEHKKMKLEELLAQNPEAREEVEQIRAAAREEGVTAERARMQSLDAIAASVTPEALQDAKYGENPTDGQTLAYQAMVSGDKLANAYMQKAMEDSKESGVEDVGVGTPDAGEQKNDESEELANYVNRRRGNNVNA